MSLIQADARSIPLRDGCVQCVVTSPPYWGLRDYGVAKQIGLEDTLDLFLLEIVQVFRDVRRVLKDDGTVWVNLGDGYDAGTRASRCPSEKAGKHGYWTNEWINLRTSTDLGPKQLLGIPWRVAFALQQDGWILRSDIIWHKPNPMPESVTDRPTKAHEYLFLFSKALRYYYDADAIKESVAGTAHAKGNGVNPKSGKNETSGDRRKDGFNERYKNKQNASFSAAVSGLVDERNKRSVWSIPTQPYTAAHFATMPEALVEPCILAGTRFGDRVYDPFIGSGTVGAVAERLGRRWVGTDLNPAYHALARTRTAQRGLRFESC